MMNNDSLKLYAPRTIAQLHKEMITADPDCSLTLCAMRRLVRSNQIASSKVGNKHLVTYAAVLEYLAGTSIDQLTDNSAHGIRKVN